MLKAATPKDSIASSVPVLQIGLQPLYSLETIVVSRTEKWFTLVSDIRETIMLLLIGPSHTVRAPPSDVHLQAA